MLVVVLESPRESNPHRRPFRAAKAVAPPQFPTAEQSLLSQPGLGGASQPHPMLAAQRLSLQGTEPESFSGLMGLAGMTGPQFRLGNSIALGPGGQNQAVFALRGVLPSSH